MWTTETTNFFAPKNTKVLKAATPDRSKSLERANEKINSKLIKSEASLMFWKEKARYSFKVGAFFGCAIGGIIGGVGTVFVQSILGMLFG